MKVYGRYFFLLCLSLSSIFSLAQSKLNNVIDEVVWVVGDDAILKSDIEHYRSQFGSSYSGNPYCVIPEQLAIQKLFIHQAAIDSVEVADADINSYVEQDINEKILLAGSKEKLEEYMQMTMTQIREEFFDQYKNQLTMQRMRETAGRPTAVTVVGSFRRDPLTVTVLRHSKMR